MDATTICQNVFRDVKPQLETLKFKTDISWSAKIALLMERRAGIKLINFYQAKNYEAAEEQCARQFPKYVLNISPRLAAVQCVGLPFKLRPL